MQFLPLTTDWKAEKLRQGETWDEKILKANSLATELIKGKVKVWHQNLGMWLHSIVKVKICFLAPENLRLMAHAYNVINKMMEANGSDVWLHSKFRTVWDTWDPFNNSNNNKPQKNRKQSVCPYIVF